MLMIYLIFYNEFRSWVYHARWILYRFISFIFDLASDDLLEYYCSAHRDTQEYTSPTFYKYWLNIVASGQVWDWPDDLTFDTCMIVGFDTLISLRYQTSERRFSLSPLTICWSPHCFRVYDAGIIYTAGLLLHISAVHRFHDVDRFDLRRAFILYAAIYLIKSIDYWQKAARFPRFFEIIYKSKSWWATGETLWYIRVILFTLHTIAEMRGHHFYATCIIPYLISIIFHIYTTNMSRHF